MSKFHPLDHDNSKATRYHLWRHSKRILIGLGVVIFLYWNMRQQYKFESVESSKKQLTQQIKASVKEKIEISNKDSFIEKTKAPPVYLNKAFDPKSYMEKDGCDFSHAIEMLRPSDLTITCKNFHEVRMGNKLGEGYWRNVYNGTFKGTNIAIKVVKEETGTASASVERHMLEAAILYQLKDSPYIVHLIGLCNSTIIVEWQPGKVEDIVFDKSVPLSTLDALLMALDMARGVRDLHEAEGGPYVHSDIQPRQFLINAEGRVVLNDFNRIKYAGKSNLPGKPSKCYAETFVAKGRWRAPEEYSYIELDEKIDVYSLGFVFWTLASREYPLEDVSREKVYKDVVEKGLRPDIRKMQSFPRDMIELIEECWHSQPERRPSARDIATRLKKIIKDFSPQ